MCLIRSLILGTYLSASTMRMTRTVMLEVLRQDYIRTAWSKELLERSVILRHAVKNAIISMVSAGVGGESVLRHGGGVRQPADRSPVPVAGPADSVRNERGRRGTYHS